MPSLKCRKEVKMIPRILQRPTLVLNRNWQPINVATVARALVLLWNESARVVDPADFQLYTWADWSRLRPGDGEPAIRAVRFRLRVPEVIALSSYDRVPRGAVAFSRRNLFKRDRNTCQYCGAQPGKKGTGPICRNGPQGAAHKLDLSPFCFCDELTIDHVVPRAQGGVSSWENCVLACVACNKRKADRTPEQAGMRLRHKPIRPHWRPLYAEHAERIESWSKFISEAYWNVTLQQ
jgi:5-methylcytosine-specific restriction endonuclease McrA